MCSAASQFRCLVFMPSFRIHCSISDGGSSWSRTSETDPNHSVASRFHRRAVVWFFHVILVKLTHQIHCWSSPSTEDWLKLQFLLGPDLLMSNNVSTWLDLLSKNIFCSGCYHVVYETFTSEVSCHILTQPLLPPSNISWQPGLVQSGFSLTVGAVRWSVVFGEGFELESVKRVLPTSDVLHGVLSSAALTEETKQGRGHRETMIG